MKRIAATGILLSLFISMPALAQSPYPKSVSDLVANAKANITRIDMHEFKKILDREKPLTIDVRELDEFAAGHIPGAINIPRGVIEFRIWPYVGYPEKTDMNKRLYLYCGSGSRCSLAAKSLQDLGFTNVVAVDMKIEEWQAAGYPITEPELM